MLTTLGPDGWATVREHPERIQQVREEVERMGLKVVVQYALMGQWDFLNIIEAPDEKAMANAAVALWISTPCACRPATASAAFALLGWSAGITQAFEELPVPRATAFLLLIQ